MQNFENTAGRSATAHTHTHTHTHTHRDKDTETHTHACTHAHTQRHTHSHRRTHMRAHTHQTHVHTHTHTHTHTRSACFVHCMKHVSLMRLSGVDGSARLGWGISDVNATTVFLSHLTPNHTACISASRIAFTTFCTMHQRMFGVGTHLWSRWCTIHKQVHQCEHIYHTSLPHPFPWVEPNVVPCDLGVRVRWRTRCG